MKVRVGPQGKPQGGGGGGLGQKGQKKTALPQTRPRGPPPPKELTEAPTGEGKIADHPGCKGGGGGKTDG